VTQAGATPAGAATLSLGGTGNLLPNGALPAGFPPISDWGGVPPLLIYAIGDSTGTYTVTAITSCSAASPPPAVNAGGVVNDGNYSAEGVAPGSIVGIFGTNLASNTVVGGTIPLSDALDTVASVTFNGVPAGLYFVGPSQINAQLPFESLAEGATSGTVDVVVTTAAGSSVAQTVNVLAAVPGIFTVNQTGLGQAIATDNNDNALAAATGSIAGLTTHPISISSGHALIIWCTGLGAVTPPIADGANSYSSDGSFTLRRSVLTPTVTVGGVPVQTVYASVLSPQFVSEYQVGVGLAADTPTGDAVPVQIAIDGITTSNKVTIAVAP